MTDYANPAALVSPEWAQQHLDDPASASSRWTSTPPPTSRATCRARSAGTGRASCPTASAATSPAARTSRRCCRAGHRPGHPHRALRRQQQLVRGLGLLAAQAARLVEHVSIINGGRKYWLDNGLPVTMDVPSYPATGVTLPEPDFALRAFRDDILPRLGDAGAVARGRALAGRVQRRGHRASRHDRDRPARRPHPGRDVRALGADGQRGRHLQDADELAAHYAAKGVTRRQGHHRLLPDRRALEPHLVRAPRAARLPAGPQLRRLLDRVGLDGQRAHREPRGRLTSTLVYRVASTAR